jgi:hypothetical protein
MHVSYLLTLKWTVLCFELYRAGVCCSDFSFMLSVSIVSEILL